MESLGSSFIGEIVYNGEKRYPYEHFFREKNVDNNRSELSGIVLF